MKDRTESGIGAEGQALDWSLIPWDSVDKRIRKLRQRIFRATREQKWNVVRSLMKLMLRSYFNLLVSVRRVTQKNKGKKTAGVDKEVALTFKSANGSSSEHGQIHGLEGKTNQTSIYSETWKTRTGTPARYTDHAQ